MKVDASCHCGRVTYEADINPDQVVICHCADCQTFASAPYRVSVFGVSAENFRLKGAPKTYVKTGGSGRKVMVAFCANCGSALYSTPDDKTFNLRVGAIRQREQLIPKAQGFCKSGLPWAMNLEGIHRIPEPDRV